MAGCSPEAMLAPSLVIAKLLNLMFFSKIFLEIRIFHRYGLRIQYKGAAGWRKQGICRKIKGGTQMPKAQNLCSLQAVPVSL